LAAQIAPPVFAMGLMILLSVALEHFVPKKGDHGLTTWYQVLSVFVLLYCFSRFMGYRVDVNEFSLHNAYRNRLVRCYLGATNDERRPQPFTGFDEADNIYLNDLRGLGAPFHILNATLNVVKGKELALQARKARSFVFTPLYSGFDDGEPAAVAPIPSTTAPETDAGNTRAPQEGSFRLTKNCSLRSKYPGARLGTAMAISGAAASPSMGRYTTGAVAFLLTIFSVRLGWWLGNSRYKKAWESGHPRSSWRAVMNELTGNTNDEAKEIYLSDGGHFENLGLYELVRRRCRVIIACDAGADRSYTCDDLASAIEKCRVDFATQIAIEVGPLAPAASEQTFVKGTISYPDKTEGTLIYIKPTMNAPNLPQDVRAYARTVTDFPQQSTIDQWFDESQFEAYRALGFACAAAATDAITQAIGSQLISTFG
jgi:hypothetical protein